MDRAESGFRRRRNRRGRGRPLYKTLKCRAGEGNLPEKIPANYSHLFTALLLQATANYSVYILAPVINATDSR
jgi:hypothetical protein